tara:strand:- start:450 stop:1439 length:990 start_codon:yes stop_codon:yes gene_type:complete
MKEIKSSKKTGFIKKIFVKICRIFGFELIDQSTLNFPVSNKGYYDVISSPGNKSITLGLGETSITRKVVSLDIIIKTCTSVQLVSQNKKRIFERDKSEYTFRTINSLIKSASQLKKSFNNLKINFTVIDINSIEIHIDEMISKFKNKGFDVNFIAVKNVKKNDDNMSTTMASIKESFNLAKKCNDLVYFVEDDYIHKNEALTEMLFAYEKFCSIFKDEIFLLSTDYPYLYKKMGNSNILIGENIHWRTVKESLLTFMTSKKMIEKHYDKLIDMATNQSNPFEKNLHEIYEKEKCISPIPSLSIHCANINSVFGLSPNINLKKLWDENKD